MALIGGVLHSTSADEKLATISVDLTVAIVNVASTAVGRRRGGDADRDRQHKPLNDAAAVLRMQLATEEVRSRAFKGSVLTLVEYSNRLLAGHVSADEFRRVLADAQRAAESGQFDYQPPIEYQPAGFRPPSSDSNAGGK